MVVARDEQLQCQWCVHTCVHACACKCCCDHGGPRRPSVQVQAKPSCPSSRIILDPTLPNVLIHARCLLTNAHVVADASYVEATERGGCRMDQVSCWLKMCRRELEYLFLISLKGETSPWASNELGRPFNMSGIQKIEGMLLVASCD